jgi:hypothetical protein
VTRIRGILPELAIVPPEMEKAIAELEAKEKAEAEANAKQEAQNPSTCEPPAKPH